MAKQKHQTRRAVVKSQTRPARGQVGVCTTCGTVLEFAGHVNLDLDLRVHREQQHCLAAGVLYRPARKGDHVDFDRSV